MARKKMAVLLEFVPPAGVTFPEIRDFIVEWLESGGGSRHPDDPLFHSLGEVRVSKPITAWRDPAQKPRKPFKVVDFPKKEA